MTTATDAVYFAAGFNNAAGYAIVPLQPTTVGPMMKYASTQFGLSRTRLDQGMYSKLLYPRISTTYFNTLNSFFGFSAIAGVKSIDGTFHLRYDDNAFYDYNGTIGYVILGAPTERGFMSWLNVEYVISGLVKL